MNRILRLALFGTFAVALSWVTYSAITAQSPPRHEAPQWDDRLAFHVQPGSQPGPGRGGVGDRPPPRDEGFGPPGGAGGPEFGPPGRRGPRNGPPPGHPPGHRPPHDSGGPPPRHSGLGGRPEIEHLQQVDPEMAELVKQDHALEQQTYQLAQAYQRAPEERQAEIRASLAEVVKTHFDVRQNRRKLELKRLEDELTRLREAIDARSKAQEQIVNRRIAEVIGDDLLKF